MPIKARLRLAVALLGATALSPLFVPGQAQAQTLGALSKAVKGGIPMAAAPVPGAPTMRPGQSSGLPDRSVGQLRALNNAAQVALRADVAKQANAAARASLAAQASSVPNGLQPGGLVVAANAVRAVDDPTGVRTWQGANLPTEVSNGGIANITIKQTESRAVLSWESFNVGKDTVVTFDQSGGGAGRSDWTALNRIVGRIEPATGRRNDALAPAPSQILGSIKADGNVIVINPDGVLFSATAQVNTRSLIVSAIDVGRSQIGQTVQTLADRNRTFLSLGLLGEADQITDPTIPTTDTFSAVANDALEGVITVASGARISSAAGGYVMLLGPRIDNGGEISSDEGQIILQAGRRVVVRRSDDPDTADFGPDLLVRGFRTEGNQLSADDPDDYVVNRSTGILTAKRGSILLGTSNFGSVLQDGHLLSSTSVARNGAIRIEAPTIRLGADSSISVMPDANGETIPQSASSVAAFKTTDIRIGSLLSSVDIEGGAMIVAPSADLAIGAGVGRDTALPRVGAPDGASFGQPRIFVGSGAVIDLGGMKDVVLSGSRNVVTISPVKKNELRDTPEYRESFLNGLSVTVDPRLSGVRADGVRWVGSPLIEAASFYEQVGATAAELMTGGGNLSIGTLGVLDGTDNAITPDVVIGKSSVIDISGGWVRYLAGSIRTTRLVTAAGQVVDIGAADPNVEYVGTAGGFTETVERLNYSKTYANPLLSNDETVAEFVEGRDAGTLRIKSPSVSLEGDIHAEAYIGERQAADAATGTATSPIQGDFRRIQATPSQLPIGGLLGIQTVGNDSQSADSNGASFLITGEPLAESLAPGDYGQTITIEDDALIISERTPESVFAFDAREIITLSADRINGFGLSQLSLLTSGSLTIDESATLDVGGGGVFEALAGRALTIDGTLKAAEGQVRLETFASTAGSAFSTSDDVRALGDHDVRINGTIDVSGRFVNNFGAGDSLTPAAWLNGGLIDITAATHALLPDPAAPTQQSIDISGSILIAPNATLDLSAGGHVDVSGKLNLATRGGDLSLSADTFYFQFANSSSTQPKIGEDSTLRITSNAERLLAPGAINARIVIPGGTVKAFGFAAGGTFSLTTPALAFGTDPAATGTTLPLDFFSTTGFGRFDLTSYGSALIENRFANNLGGYNALLMTQTLTVGSGQTLNLSRARFAPFTTPEQTQALQALASDGDLSTILTPGLQASAYDRDGVALNLHGLTELVVAGGGSITGDAGAAILAPKLRNDGTIRLLGGSVTQQEVLPLAYGVNSAAASSLDQIFSVDANGRYAENALNAGGILASGSLTTLATNAAVAENTPIYLLGTMGRTDGIVLGEGSVTDLSGAVLLNPRAPVRDAGDVRPIRDGLLLDGGAFTTSFALTSADSLFRTQTFGSPFLVAGGTSAFRPGRLLRTEAGATIALSGVADSLDRLNADYLYVPTPQWSNAGTLTVGAGGSVAGAIIDARGGAAAARDGTLNWLNPVLVATAADETATDLVSAETIARAGFDSFQALGSLSSRGDVQLDLARAFYLSSRPYDNAGFSANLAPSYMPTLDVDGTLVVNTAVAAFRSVVQSPNVPAGSAEDSSGTVTINARSLDIAGASLIAPSVASLTFDIAGDIRLIGVQPTELTFGLNANIPNSLVGQLVGYGDMRFRSRQLYPTTGSTFLLASLGAEGSIAFARSTDTTPPAPWSAGGALTVRATTIDQSGVLRVPLGRLTLGGNDVTDFGPSANLRATQSLSLGEGSITSVSLGGRVVPYGTTTDGLEYFFAPTGSDPLTAPPQAILGLAGAAVTVAPGAVIDTSGGGDIYAYEFVPGTSGSRDVLDRFNNDPFSSNNGLQYPDGRQIYAIVPSLGDSDIALYDPIYSGDYADLYEASGVGRRVYLSGGPGLAAGWYTLLPAKYATLPGGLRVVEQTGMEGSVPDRSFSLRDGSMMVSGYYGDSASGGQDATVRTFTVQTQDVFEKYSLITLTSGSEAFTKLAGRKGTSVPRLPADAGRLVISPLATLDLGGTLLASSAQGGRGGSVDISGGAFEIRASREGAAPESGAIVLDTASLNTLNAASLLIGGTRTERADGTTALDVTANSILVANGPAEGATVNPLKASEILLAVDGSGSSITIADGSALLATGTLVDGQTGDYVFTGTQEAPTGGALLRVAAGAERLLTREGTTNGADASVVIGAASLTSSGSAGATLIDSSGSLSVSPEARLTQATSGVDSLALGANSIAFLQDGQSLEDAFVVTPELQANFSVADRLNIRSSEALVFAGGTYNFGEVVLDSAGIAALGGEESSAVTINAAGLTINGSDETLAGCGQGSAPACGTGTLTINTGALTFGSGNVATYGFGAEAVITASAGTTYSGQMALDLGTAALRLTTPFLVDRDVATTPPTATTTTTETPPAPALAVTTTGDIVIGKAAGTTAQVVGRPGATLSLDARNISISGTELRATSGRLGITASADLNVAAGTILGAPGYARSFGDAQDPWLVSAPAGAIRLESTGGNVALAAGSILDVAATAGKAGAITLFAPQGTLGMGAELRAQSPQDGGSFLAETAGSFDLPAFIRSSAAGFRDMIDISAGLGALTIEAGQQIAAATVRLDAAGTADGDGVFVAGTIDATGVNGGSIALYGAREVELASTAKLNARATGYAAQDTRRAEGGDVRIGIAEGGIGIDIAAGAVIDVSAERPGDRLIAETRNKQVYYTYVEGDEGGTVLLRAPIRSGEGGAGVDIDVAGSILGARDITVEAYRHVRLEDIAAGGFSGVTFDPVTRDATITIRPDGNTPNYFSGNAPGGLIDFIQNFDIAASYGRLGNLASLDSFHARPGIELAHTADIRLASHWNFGAGEVNEAQAIAAGVLLPIPGSSTRYYVAPGREGELLENHTRMLYRVGGRIGGEAPIVTLRSPNDIIINGSITDGFFTFRDQTDPAFLTGATGLGGALYTFAVNTAVTNNTSVSISTPTTQSSQAEGITYAPFNAAVNSPWSPGAGTNGAGDPIGSAALFPTLAGGEIPQSASYRIVAGADIDHADPLKLDAGASGSLTVEGSTSYALGSGEDTFDDEFLLRISRNNQPTIFGTIDSLLALGLSGSTPTFLFVNGVPTNRLPYYNFLRDRAATFFADHPGEFTTTLGGVVNNPTNPRQIVRYNTTLGLVTEFLESVAPEIVAAFQNPADPLDIRPNSSGGASGPQVTVPNLIRTGTGSIDLAATGKIDLRNGETPTYLTPTRGPATVANGLQVGGVAVYTAGGRAGTGNRTITDSLTGNSFALAADQLDTQVFQQRLYNGQPGYTYGSTNARLRGVLIPDAAYASGGGDITITSRADVLARRNVLQEASLAPSFAPFLGTGDQAWVNGSIGQTSNFRINPQLFNSGVGTLGGGDIRISAGGVVSDVTVAAPSALTTLSVVGTSALWRMSGGDVSIAAGGDILGGLLDIGRGDAVLTAGGSVADSGTMLLPGLRGTGQSAPVFSQAAETLRIRLSDATVAVNARGAITVEGVGALGAQNAASSESDTSIALNPLGFYSSAAGVSLFANDAVTLLTSGQTTQAALPMNDGFRVAVLPGSVAMASLASDVSLASAGTLGADLVTLYPDADGDLLLAAGRTIAPAVLSMLDVDPGLLPGAFSDFAADQIAVRFGRGFGFPAALPDSSQSSLAALHNEAITHAGDSDPARIYAGLDINRLIVDLPKQSRITAGRDIVDMVFFGQNLAASDITRITAGRDITATTSLVRPVLDINRTLGTEQGALQGNLFILGGPGRFYLEAGRDLGPFLNSATANAFQAVGSTTQDRGTITFGGGVLTVGNERNPHLGETGASLSVAFGIGNGAKYDALRETYLNPANIGSLDDALFAFTLDPDGNRIFDRTRPVYEPLLRAWLLANAPAELSAAVGNATPTYEQAYAVFAGLSPLRQRSFLVDTLYFNELEQTSVPSSPSFERYSRAYRAVNTLFPPELGYTANSLDGGEAGASETKETGNLDLRLATLQTARGGDLTILGPGGRIIAGSTVRTSEQAARRTYDGGRFFQGRANASGDIILPAAISAIPTGLEGILTLRGGAIRSFTDSDLLLNQSRLFSQGGGNITLFSSNGDLNAGQGPKTSSNFPPVTFRIDSDGNFTVDAVGGVSGAGIAAFLPSAGAKAPDVFLIAPRGTVDAGDAGVRVAGNLFVAAQAVANSENFSVGGETSGVVVAAGIDTGTAAAGSAAANAAQQAAAANTRAGDREAPLSDIDVEVEGYDASADRCAQGGSSGSCN